MRSVADVVIYGGGMLGHQVAHILLNFFSDRFRLVGFVDDVKPAGSEVIEGIETVGSLEQVIALEKCSPENCLMLFAIGYTDMRSRRTAFEKAVSVGYKMEGLVHPGASVDPSAKLGSGAIVLAGAVVDQHVAVGDICYLHNGAIVGENTVLGTNNYLSAGTTMGGSIIVGDDNFFGINATIVNDISIGSNCFINAGSLVYKALADDMRIVEFREQREVRNT